MQFIELMGGRKSGKTTAVIIFWVILCFYLPVGTFGIYAFRNLKNQAMDLFTDICNTLEALGVQYKTIRSRMEITVNGNTMRIVGANNNRKGQGATLTGLPKFADVKYGIVWFEERFQFSEEDYSAIIQAVRSISNNGGQTKYLYISTSNPWAKSHPYVKRMISIQPFNTNIMKEVGSQIGIYEKKYELGEEIVSSFQIIHYTNWRIAKQYLGKNEIMSILEQWKINPVQAPVIDYGAPGYESGQIYTHLLNNIGKSVYQPHEYIVGGVDYGWGRESTSGKTIALFAGISIDNGIDIYDELEQDNHSGKVESPIEVGEKIVEFYWQNIVKYANAIGWGNPKDISFTVRVDNANVSLIAILNDIARRRNLHFINFTRCKKLPINDRIEVTLAIMSRSKLRISQSVKELVQEMELAYYEKDAYVQKRAKENDHALNAFEYMIEPAMNLFAREHQIYNMSMKGQIKW